MPFIGKNPTSGFSTIVKDDLTADGSTTAFTLSKQVASANDVAVFVGNVRQEPTDAYSVNGTTLTMTAAPASGINFYVLHIAGTLESSVIPADDTISTTKLQNDAVTSAKMDTNIALDGTLTLNGVAAQTTYAIQTQTKSVYLNSTDSTYSNLTLRKGSATTTDYLQLRDSSNNLDFKIDSEGRVTKSSQPAFYAQLNTGGDVTVNANNIFPCATAVYNVGSHYNTSTYTFTAPIDGKYLLWGQTWSKTGGNQARMSFRKNGTSTRLAQHGYHTAPTDTAQTMFLIVQLSANDYVAMYADDSNHTVHAGGTPHTFWGGYFLG